jgi:hypothetical protein
MEYRHINYGDKSRKNQARPSSKKILKTASYLIMPLHQYFEEINPMPERLSHLMK